MMAMERRTAIHIFRRLFTAASFLDCCYPILSGFSADYTLYDLTDSSQFSHKVNTNFSYTLSIKRKQRFPRRGFFMEDMNTQLNNMNQNNNDDKENKKKGRVKRAVKRGTGIAICAVLAGGLAAGAYEGVNRLTGWNERDVVAATKEDNKAELLQTKSDKDSSGSKEESSSDSGTEAKGSLDVSDIAEEAMKFVVSITTKSVEEVQNYYGYFGFGNGFTTQQEVEGSGSGIIVGKNDDELLIATNYHVIEGADNVSVTCVDGEVYEASVKGYDADRDLAVVSVALDDISDDTMDAITIAPIGSSDDLKIGEQVIAIGNALGYGQSVTTGIVSAKNRQLDDNGQAEEDSDGVNLIQTDAAINPGNSGGALLNMDGEVVGINSAKLASTEVEGMGYAIAISDVSDILEDLMNETPRDIVENHGVLSITGSSVSEEGQAYGIPEGVFVRDVTKDGAADKAGIKANNVITEFDGKRVRSIESLIELLQYYEPGEEVEVTLQVMDGDGYKEKTVTVTLDEDTSEDTDDSEDSQDSSDEESILRDWENGNEDSMDYEEFFGMW